MAVMPRQLRIDYPGAIHHVMSREDRREDICHDEVDRQEFRKTFTAVFGQGTVPDISPVI